MAMLEKQQARVVAAVEASRDRELEWAGDARTRAGWIRSLPSASNARKRAALLTGVNEVVRGFAGWYQDLAVVAAGAEEAAQR